eukprot:6257297-Ditylum_brightwellii.AAC.1
MPRCSCRAVATKSSAAHALNTKEATLKGILPKTGVALPLCSLLRHTSFGRGRVLAGIAHRQGKRNM